MLNLKSGDQIELFYEDAPATTIRATVGRLLTDRDEGMGTEVEDYIACWMEITVVEPSDMNPKKSEAGRSCRAARMSLAARSIEAVLAQERGSALAERPLAGRSLDPVPERALGGHSVRNSHPHRAWEVSRRCF